MIRNHAPNNNDLYVRTLELEQVKKSNFFSHTIHDDLDSIAQDIRQNHVADRTTADQQPTFTEVKEWFDRAMQLSSNEERVIYELCDLMQISFDKTSSEDFSAFMRNTEHILITEKSQQHAGKGSATGIPWDKKEKAQIAEKTVAFLRATVFSKVAFRG